MSVAARIRTRFKERGLSGSLRSLWRFVRSKSLAYELDAYIVVRRGPPRDAQSAIEALGYQFAPVTVEDPQTLEALINAWPAEWMYGRSPSKLRVDLSRDLQAGDQCYAVWDHGRIAAASWVGFAGSPYMKRFGGALGLGRDEALRRTTFVAPAYRGKKLQVLLANTVESHVARTNGIKRFIVYIGIRNTASIRNLTKVYEEVRPVYHFRVTVLGKSFDWYPNLKSQSWTPIAAEAQEASR